MILYNIRQNGPYEYDKFVLNIYQLYNLTKKEKEYIANHEIYAQLEELDALLKSKVVNTDTGITTLDRLLLLIRNRGKK